MLLRRHQLFYFSVAKVAKILELGIIKNEKQEEKNTLFMGISLKKHLDYQFCPPLRTYYRAHVTKS